MKVMMGIGNELRGDDSVGIYVARNFKKEGWHVIVAGQVPEDFTADIKKLQPEHLVLVDAALMGLSPGEMRRVPVEKIPSVAFSTHGMPLSFFISYLSEYVDKVTLIGIEPLAMEFGTGMSEVVKKAADSLLSLLLNERFSEIPTL
ncbi:MAG: hydrogenase maturation peptidase HycI [Euryarchaeota archaeon]|nr:hydrogenase maturation peptidase HycI [Euryarchaeota archaeon]